MLSLQESYFDLGDMRGRKLRYFLFSLSLYLTHTDAEEKIVQLTTISSQLKLNMSRRAL